MTNSIKVSFIIPCFNHGEFLPEAVASITRTGRDDIELIVIDDGSTDARTRIEMGKIAAQGIHVIRQENKGLAAARNAGVLASRGKYIFPLDADDRLSHGWIDRGILKLDGNPKIGVVYGDAQCFGTRTDRWRVGQFDSDQLLDLDSFHASALYRRSIWDGNGGYDGTMPVQGFEDWDFWIGALEHGWHFFYMPEIFFEYRQATESMITRAQAFGEVVGEFVVRKHSPLYRAAWLRLRHEHQSIKKTTRRLGRLLGLRVKERLNKSTRNP